ncbi:hypothetical protein [Neobacillus sp. D3-1R]
MNNNNNGNHNGHQDPKPEHGKDQNGHKGGDKPRIPTNPGTSHALVK